jgi:hypothetical protein
LSQLFDGEGSRSIARGRARREGPLGKIAKISITVGN